MKCFAVSGRKPCRCPGPYGEIACLCIYFDPIPKDPPPTKTISPTDPILIDPIPVADE